jgi:ATP-dependent helicase/nuclease subunit A
VIPASDKHIAFEWAGGIARAVGIVVHGWLQHIAESGPQDWTPDRVASLAPSISRALAAEGLIGDELATGRDRVVQALQNTLADERGRWLLSAHEDARNELAVGASDSGVLREFRIDRAFVADGARWIVDYKTSTHEGGRLDEFLDREVDRYRLQLENYARLLTQIEGRPVRLGLYFPLLKAWRSWNFETGAEAPRVLTKESQLQLPI